MLLPDWVMGLKRPIQVGLVAAVAVALYSLSWPNYYRSEVRVLPVEGKASGGLSNLVSAAAAFGVTVPAGEGSDANFLDILNSRWFRENLLRSEFSFKLRTWRFGSEVRRTQTLYEYLKSENMDQAVAGVVGVFSASRDLKTRVLTLSAETVSPDLSQRVVQRAARLLETFVQEKGRTRGGFKANFAEARLREAREEMAGIEEDYRKFLESNRNFQVSTDPSVRICGTRLEAELKLRQQLVMTLALNREQALMEEKNDLPILNILDEGNLPIEKSKPSRSVYVFFGFLIGMAGFWIWLNFDLVKNHLLDLEKEEIFKAERGHDE